MEVLYSARTSAEFVALELELDALRILRNDRAVADAAMGAIAELAERSDGYHGVPLPDALIAAAAAEHGGLAVFLSVRTRAAGSIPLGQPPQHPL